MDDRWLVNDLRDGVVNFRKCMGWLTTEAGRLLALAERGIEVEGATEAWVANTDLHHVNDSHKTRRRVLILPAKGEGVTE